MWRTILLPTVTGLVIEHIFPGECGLTIVVRLTSAQMSCPRCGQVSERIHSRAQRLLLDVPCSGQPVHLRVHLRRFICSSQTCPARTFREQVPALALPRARRTQRLQALLREVGLALAAEAGARLATRLGMACSPDTLLRLVGQVPTPQFTAVRVLGIDDWSYRKGTRYGTILLDLEQRIPIDLLPDRELGSVVAWLRAHPGIEIISRDRGSTYAEAGRVGAPRAQQVADRWHLLKNLGEMMQRLVARYSPIVQQVERQMEQLQESTAPQVAPSPRSRRHFGPRRAPAPVHRVRRAWQHQTYQQVHDLTQLGWSYGAIAAYLHINRHTVSKYARRDHWVESAFGSRASTAEPYREYLEQRWDKGCSNRRQLWRELQEQGFAGSYISVWKLTRGWVPLPGTEVDVIAPPADRPPPLVPPRPAARHTVRQVAWLLQASADRLPSDDAFCQVLGTTCPDLALAAELAQSFGSLIREHRLEALDAWLAQAESSGLRELRRFALSLRQDYAAVRAAVEEMWSQGPTEGHIQRLKLLKRQGYGRASFRLLRQRVLLRPAVKTPM